MSTSIDSTILGPLDSAQLANLTTTDKSGRFGWFLSIGATPQAVAVLNDQPILFTILIIVLIVIPIEILFVWFIHHATLKPEQKKKKKVDDKKKPAEKK